MNVEFSKYGFKPTYDITKGTTAGDFLECEFRKHFNYIQKSEREQLADVWINPKFGYNLKTSRADVKSTGRLCTAKVGYQMVDPEFKLIFVHLIYTNNNGKLVLESLSEYYLEEIEYNISNQGIGLLQPKTINKTNKFRIRPRVSREDWL